jgi:hypothetical protein
MSADTLPDTFHVAQIAGTIFYVSSDVRKEIEAFLRSTPAPTDFIIVDSISEEEITIIADAVSGIWSTSPKSRAIDGEIRRRLKAEDPTGDD